MHAAVLNAFGGPEVLHYQEVPDPTVTPERMLVRVHAAGVCGFDCRVREGLPGYNVSAGVILGHEFAGEIVAVGEHVSDFAVGDRVTVLQQGFCGRCEFCLRGEQTVCPHYHETTYGSADVPGGYAELVLVDPSTAAKVPDGVDWASAAIAACGIGVALHALNRGQFRLAERVLVTGASGGLGIHALQLARAAGCEVVAVTSSQSKAERLSQFADRVVLYRDGRFDAPDVRPDLIIENTAGITLPASLRAIRRGGRVVIAGMVATDPVPFMPGPFFAREINLLGSNATSMAELTAVLGMLAAKKIQAVISEQMPLSRAADAHAMLDAGKVTGRVVLTPGHDT